jgi:outer membrane protein TolC
VTVTRPCFALLVAALWCAAPRADTVTLDQAVDRALQHDPRIDEVNHLVDAARTLVDQAQGHRGWGVSLNSFLGLAPSVNGGLFENNTCTSDNCQVRSDAFDLNGLSPWLNITLSIVKPLNTFGKIKHYTQAARANVEVKQGDVRLRRGETVLEVKRAYYGYLAARDSALFLADVKKRIDGLVDMVQRWLDEGSNNARQSDLYALQAASALVARYLAEAQATEQVALDGLKVLTGAGVTGELEVADRALAPVEMPPEELPALMQRALDNRPEMAQVKAGLEARRALVAANKSDAWPDLYAGVAGLLSYAPTRSRLDNPLIYDPFNTFGLTPLVGLRWEWTRGVQSAKASEAEAELNALIAKSEFARQGIPYQVAEQYHQVHATHDEADRLAEASRAARRWMVASFADFEAGVEKGDKVVTAFQGYVLAYTDYLKTVFDYNMHVAQLANVTGAER